MKISNLFKKKNDKTSFSNFDEMKKEQITKVLGGSGATNSSATPVPTPDDAARVKSHSNQNNN
jgi:hypothetical protein